MYKKIISISLGSTSRDMSVVSRFQSHTFEITRTGMNGSLEKLTAAIGKYASEADMITIGGLDFCLSFTKKSYMFRDVAKLFKRYPNIHLVDGENFRQWAEPAFFKKAQASCGLSREAGVLLPLAANRVPLIRSMLEEGFSRFVFGDFIYDIGFPPIPIRKLRTYEAVGYLASPIITRLPFTWIYPVGDKQVQHKIRRPDLFDNAEIIAGDFHNIHIYLPEKLGGKTIITNTVTAADVALMKERGLKYLVTFSPSFDGRTFGANVMDGVITCYLKETGGSLRKEDYLLAAAELGIQPEVRRLSD